MILNGKTVKFGCFPNKELNLPIADLNMQSENLIRWRYKDNEDIFKLAMVASHIKSSGASASLYVEYLPYSRMDRPNGCFAVTLKCIADMINNMDFKKVTVREPHSPASIGMINNAVPHWWCAERLDSVMALCDADSIFYPDNGAVERYETQKKYDFAYGKKKRNFNNGEIIGMRISGTVGSRVLIVDDLCSRGGTFINATKLLKEEGAKNVYLLVAHCENNIFNGEIFTYIDRVFTAEEMLDSDHPRVTKLK